MKNSKLRNKFKDNLKWIIQTCIEIATGEREYTVGVTGKKKSGYWLGSLKSYCVQNSLWYHCGKQNGNETM